MSMQEKRLSFIRSTDYSAAIFPAYVYESFKSPQQKNKESKI
jgi:hypothetical protein